MVLYYQRIGMLENVLLGLVEFENGAILEIANSAFRNMLGLVEFENGAILQ